MVIIAFFARDYNDNCIPTFHEKVALAYRRNISFITSLSRETNPLAGREGCPPGSAYSQPLPFSSPPPLPSRLDPLVLVPQEIMRWKLRYENLQSMGCWGVAHSRVYLCPGVIVKRVYIDVIVGEYSWDYSLGNTFVIHVVTKGVFPTATSSTITTFKNTAIT